MEVVKMRKKKRWAPIPLVMNGNVGFEIREFTQAPKLTRWKLKLSYIPFPKSYPKCGNDHERDSDKSFFSQYQMLSNE